MNRRMGLVAGVLFTWGAFDWAALGISCGTDQPDVRFNAVCGLAPRSRAYDQDWFPTGSGTLVRWTDSEETEHVGIVTIRHFISSGGNGGDCVQSDLWFAYFRPCVDPPPWPPPSFACPENPCPDDEVVVVRVTCFTMASGAFFGGDCVLVGEIEAEDFECIAHITPMTVASPYSLGLCRDQPVYVGGWGKTLDANCDLVAARSLHVAASTISSINCDMDGRGGAIMRTPGSCVVNGACLPQSREHDSGGAVAVELQDGSLCLVGVNQGGNGETLIAARHQFFSDPSATDYLCMPCRPIAPCGDIDGSGSADIDDRTALQDLVTLADGPFEVGCFCLGDMDGDGCAGTAADIALIYGGVFGQPCTHSNWCYGDANLDGEVDASDAAFVAGLILNEQTACPACTSCPPLQEWCPGDVDCSGEVTEEDLEIIQILIIGGSYSCGATIPGCCRPSSDPEDPECTTCP